MINGTPESGTTLFKARTIGTDNSVESYTVPGAGILFVDGMSIKYTVGTIDMMHFYYA